MHPIRAPRRAILGVLAAAALAVGALNGCTQPTEPTETTAPVEGGVGFTHTSDDGLGVTITGRICGISGVGSDKPDFAAVGQYCTVGVKVDNGTGEEVNLMHLKISGWDDETEYFHDYWAAEAADGALSTLPAGDEVSTTLFFDMPKQTTLDKVSISGPWAGIDGVEVAF